MNYSAWEYDLLYTCRYFGLAKLRDKNINDLHDAFIRSYKRTRRQAMSLEVLICGYIVGDW